MGVRWGRLQGVGSVARGCVECGVSGKVCSPIVTHVCVGPEPLPGLGLGLLLVSSLALHKVVGFV